MNILSMLTLITATVITVVTIINYKKEYNERLRPWIVCVEASLGWWCFTYAFFFVAKDREAALFWHRIAALGWTTFAPFTAMYFIVYTGQEHWLDSLFRRVIFWSVPIILLIKNLLGHTTAVLIDVVQSTSGLGWTYVSDVTDPWYWLFLIQLIAYFTIAFVALFNYRQHINFAMKKALVNGFIILDAFVLTLGLVTDFILPHFTTWLPPLSNIAVAIFEIGYFSFIYRYDVFNIDNVVTSRDILETSTNLILLLDASGIIIRCNSATTHVLGYDRTEILGKPFKAFLPTGEYKREVLETLYDKKSKHNIDSRLKAKNGDILNTLLSASIVEDKYQAFKGVVVSIHDVTGLIEIQNKLKTSNEAYRRLNAQLYELSYFDQLTHLPNRRKFYEILENYRNRYETQGIDFGVIYTDLDGFKQVNDAYGHEVGDRVLIEAAQRLTSPYDSISSEQVTFPVARMGGDEFVCIISADSLKGAVDMKALLAYVARYIVNQFERPIMVGDMRCEIGISIGYWVYSDSLDIDVMLREADHEMYHRKREKKR